MRSGSIACVMCSIVLAVLSSGCADRGAPRAPIDTRRAPNAESRQSAQAVPAAAAPRQPQTPHRSSGQTLYLPVYSHVYWGPRPTPFNLACTLSVRNVDPRIPIEIATVDYYDTAGILVGHYLEQPLALAPLATTEFYVNERDVSGGSGANFIVAWTSAEPANLPVVEAVMIGIDAGQGISFVTEAREIAE